MVTLFLTSAGVLCWLESMALFTGKQKWIEIFAGIVLILSGLYLLNQYFFVIPISPDSHRQTVGKLRS